MGKKTREYTAREHAAALCLRVTCLAWDVVFRDLYHFAGLLLDVRELAHWKCSEAAAAATRCRAAQCAAMGEE